MLGERLRFSKHSLVTDEASHRRETVQTTDSVWKPPEEERGDYELKVRTLVKGVSLDVSSRRDRPLKPTYKEFL